MDDAATQLSKDRGYGYMHKKEIDWKTITYDAVHNLVEQYKDEIINLAAEKLCESFKRTKAYKEKMNEVMN